MEINDTPSLSREEIQEKAKTLLLRMIYEQPEFNTGIDQRKRDLDKVKQEKDRELWTPMLSYLKSLVPEKWKKFMEQNFDFSYEWGGHKPSIYNMMRERLWSFMGMHVMSTNQVEVRNAGFSDLTEFVSSIPELNTAWDGFFGIAIVVPYDGKSDRFVFSAYGPKNEERSKNSKEFWDAIDKVREK